MTNTEYNVKDMHGNYSHRYNQNIIKVIFKLSMPFVAYSLIAISVTILAR